MGRRELLRIDAKVEVEFNNFEQFYREYTKNLSKGGIFIKTSNVLKPQSILEISLKLPGVNRPLSLVGEVVHVIEPELASGHGWDPGMGVHFVDFEESIQRVIEQYIARKIKQDSGGKVSDRRAHSRVAMRLRVKFPSLDVLEHDYSEDISRGGIFIQTKKPRSVGERLILTLVHPETGQEIELLGEVVRVNNEDPQSPGTQTGMGIRFVDVDKAKSKSIEKFLGLDFPVESI